MLLIRVFAALCYCLIGLLISVPISYFFQDDVLQIMSLTDYVTHFFKVMHESARFGAFDIFRTTAVICVIATVLFANLLEKVFKR